MRKLQNDSDISKKTMCGVVICTHCVDTFCSNPVCERFDDSRIHNRICNLLINCKMKKDGCTWTGKITDYEMHVVRGCILSKYECKNCKQIVNWMDTVKHRESYECCNFQRTEVLCPSNCGHMCQRWTMPIHVSKQCPHSQIDCPFGEECLLKCCKANSKEHSVKCLLTNTKRLSCMFENKTCDSFKRNCFWKYSENRPICFKSIPFFLQNQLIAYLSLVCRPKTFHLEVWIMVCHELSDETIVFMKKTKVTVRIVNNHTEPDTDFEYERPLHMKKVPPRKILFHEKDFIPLSSLFQNDTARTSYTNEGWCDFVIVFDYPSWFPHMS